MSQDPSPRPLMLGKGWFPDQLGGLDRYYRSLFTHLPEASAVVIGDAAATPAHVTAVSGHASPLPRRVLAFWRAAQRSAGAAELVDVHFALYALAPLWVGRLRRRPVLLHFHGPWAEESVAAGDASRPRRFIRLALERAAYRRAGAAVVLTSAFRQVLVERYRVSPWSVFVEAPGVDLDHFSPGSAGAARQTLGLQADGFVAVAVRRLVPRMGLELLLEAWDEAAPELPVGSTLLVVGDGPLREPLETTASARGLGGSVRFLGGVSDEQLVRLYRASDVAVVPSLEHEGFGMVVLEAAACGTPTIVADVGGLPEAAAGLDPSLIVAAADRVALRDRLLRARTHRPGRAATRAYAERFDWGGVAERHRTIMRRLVSGGVRDDRLRVVYLDHVARLSGGEIALTRLLPHLDRVQPHVVLGEDGPLVGRLHLEGVSTEVLPLHDSARQLRKAQVRRGGVSPEVIGLSAAYVLRLAARLRFLRPDVVHTNSLKAGIYGSLAARLAGIPVVWHIRDRIAEDYLPRPAVGFVRWMTRRFASAVVANSHSTLATLNLSSKSSVVLYSVLPEVMTHVSLRQRENGHPLTFGIVGRLAPWKGQDLFLRAFARAFPDGGERAVVVGGALFGEDDYAAELPSLAARLGLENRVEFRGHRPDVWEELSRLDVLVHGSITPEPFGQVILEGMAAARPVIAAHAGGPAEILRHGETGLLYEPADADALADAMRRMRDPQLRETLKTAAAVELGRYSPSVVAEELQQLYETVTARSLRR